MKLIVVLILGIALGYVIIQTKLNTFELLIFLQLSLTTCVLALLLDTRKMIAKIN